MIMKTTIETKLTVGPWKVEPFEREDGSGFAVVTENETVVAWLYQYAPNSFGRMMRTSQNHEANAKLIAAAPDLLTALKKAKEEIQAAYRFYKIDNPERGRGYNGVMTIIDEALKKATE